MGYRDDSLATRAQVDELERELEEAKQALALARVAPTASRRSGKRWPAGLAFGASLLMFAAALYAGFGVSGSSGEQVGIALGAAGVLALFAAVWLLILARLLVVVPPNQLAVVSGRKWNLPDGTSVGYRLVRGGRVLRLPLIEEVDFLDLTHMMVPIRISDCYCKGGVPVEVEAIAQVKLAGEMPLAAHAVERFLRLDREAIAAIAAPTVEGSIRAVIAEASVDDVLARPVDFAEIVRQEVDHAFGKLGLVLDTLNLGNIRPLESQSTQR